MDRYELMADITPLYADRSKWQIWMGKLPDGEWVAWKDVESIQAFLRRFLKAHEGEKGEFLNQCCSLAKQARELLGEE